MNRTAPLTRMAVPAIWIVALGMIGSAQAQAQTLPAVKSVCAACHPNANVESDHMVGHAGSTTCLSCHHIGYSDDPAIIKLRRLEACQSCHADLPATHQGKEGMSATCTDCHTIHADTAVAGVSLVSDATCTSCHKVRHTLHAGVKDAPSCTDCHTMHEAGTPTVSMVSRSPYAAAAAEAHGASSAVKKCQTCHEGVHPSHAAVEKEGNLPCTSCHEVDAAMPTARVASLLAAECTSCHASVHPAHAEVDKPVLCTDCHDFATDPPVAQAGLALSRHCATCHTDAMKGFESGAHAVNLAAATANPDLPTCVSCHDVHDGAEQGEVGVRLAATRQCIQCHSKPELAEKYGLSTNVAASYEDDFHGTTAEILTSHPERANGPNVLVCADCHGAHAVTKKPKVALSEVCAGCHKGGDRKLAGAWLGHDRIGPRNKLAIWAIRLFYFVLIPFVLAGLFLNIVFHLTDQRRKGARVWDAPGVVKIRKWLSGKRGLTEPMVTRFTVVERVEHMGAMITFTTLVLTGLPQIAPTSSPGDWFIHLFGGIANIRLVHRITGFTFVALLLMHVSRGVSGMLKTHRLPAIVPRKRDFVNAVQTIRHFLNGEPRPKLGRFDASEKFEYWGLFFGGMLMSVTGLALIFPEFVTRFLPGIVVAAMRTMHGLEATFAVLVVLLWHSYGVIFKPDIFPLDTSIFTGKISVERLKEEHELEYEKLFPERAGAD
ncbi:MAG: cytochrome b/b6 domain-containing protein [Gemmatimonadota bacterium]